MADEKPKIPWTFHLCENPILTRQEDFGKYLACYGTCPVCGDEWCYGIVNKEAILKLQLVPDTRKVS